MEVKELTTQTFKKMHEEIFNKIVNINNLNVIDIQLRQFKTQPLIYTLGSYQDNLYFEYKGYVLKLGFASQKQQSVSIAVTPAFFWLYENNQAKGVSTMNLEGLETDYEFTSKDVYFIPKLEMLVQTLDADIDGDPDVGKAAFAKAIGYHKAKNQEGFREMGFFEVKKFSEYE